MGQDLWIGQGQFEEVTVVQSRHEIGHGIDLEVNVLEEKSVFRRDTGAHIPPIINRIADVAGGGGFADSHEFDQESRAFGAHHDAVELRLDRQGGGALVKVREGVGRTDQAEQAIETLLRQGRIEAGLYEGNTDQGGHVVQFLKERNQCWEVSGGLRGEIMERDRIGKGLNGPQHLIQGAETGPLLAFRE